MHVGLRGQMLVACVDGLQGLGGEDLVLGLLLIDVSFWLVFWGMFLGLEVCNRMGSISGGDF